MAAEVIPCGHNGNDVIAKASGRFAHGVRTILMAREVTSIQNGGGYWRQRNVMWRDVTGVEP